MGWARGRGGGWARERVGAGVGGRARAKRARASEARPCPPLGAGKNQKAFLRRRPFFAGSWTGNRSENLKETGFPELQESHGPLAIHQNAAIPSCTAPVTSCTAPITTCTAPIAPCTASITSCTPKEVHSHSPFTCCPGFLDAAPAVRRATFFAV